MPRTPSLVLVLLMLGAGLFVSPALADTSRLLAQREAFIEAYPLAERGEWAAVAEREALLRDYVLWADLEAAYLRARLRAGKADSDRLMAFLSRHGDLRPGRDIRYRYAKQLAVRGKHDAYLDIYEANYANLGDALLDCYAAKSLAATQRSEQARKLSEQLWLTGTSQVKACDPVFARMRREGWMTDTLLEERYSLAVAAREFSLARYIGRSLDDSYVAEANRWMRAGNRPSAFLAEASVSLDSPVYREQLGYAAARLAVREPALAWREWQRLSAVFEFNKALHRSISHSVALWSVRRQIDDLDALLDTLPAHAVDDEVLAWQARVSLGQGDWTGVLNALDSLQGQSAREPEWRYWRAVALDRTGRPAEAMLTYGQLARERDYYGFLAADAVGVEYAMETDDIRADEDVLARLAMDPKLQRAAELFRTGLDGRARSEWDEATRDLPPEDKVQAVLLAQRWNWPSRAISLAARTGQFDSLETRYPLPHYELFEASAKGADIPVSWAYGVARSESLFMRDIRSSAGAIGLMQLMPATGRRTAGELKMPYQGIATLTDPESNIRLGSSYLAKMKNRFDGHPAVATAAYNAGPSRVSRWLPDSGDVDARIWVETIPFRETRDYVRRVLTADIIFEWRLTGTPGRLSDRLPEIRSSGSETVLSD